MSRSIIYVVMTNDHPHAAFYTEAMAQEFCDRANMFDEDWCSRQPNGAVRVHHNVRKIELHTYPQGPSFGCRDGSGFWKERYFRGDRMEVKK